MTEDMGRYPEHVKRVALSGVRTKTLKELIRTLSEIADTNKIPCITIVIWLGEHFNYPPELKVSYDSLMNFYGYTDIRGKPSGCPW